MPKKKNDINTITGDSILVYKLRNTLEKELSFKIELDEFKKGNFSTSKTEKIKTGKCSMGIEEFLSEEFLAIILKFRKEIGLD